MLERSFAMKSIKIIIWGTGWATEQFHQWRRYHWNYDVVAYIDNDQTKWYREYRGKTIFPPEEIKELEFEKIILCVINSESIYKQLVEEIQIEKNKILAFEENRKVIEKELCTKLIQKYSKDENPDIQKVLTYYQKYGFNLFGFYEPSKTEYQVYYDEEQFPYVLFEGKRMYYPKEYPFLVRDGKQFVEDILKEQQEKSPHLYLQDGEKIIEDSVMVDAGVCEGNFALRYIEKVKKVYLIEADPIWMEVLKRTFREYLDKVVFCSKYLGRYDNERSITLDHLVDEKIDFLKMDIEGMEIDALLGGKTVLEQSHAHCAICSYHKQNDEKYIRYLLQNYGYKTSTSEGYMFYVHDNDIFDSMDFRRGIVYATKE